ncbi:MAG: SDR family oxidoreductase [Chitinophagaceae bacterium]
MQKLDRTKRPELTVVITGASSGAGRAIAIELAKVGARLVLAARREEALQEVATECEGLGARAIVVVTDTRVATDVAELAKAAEDFGGTINVWVNNAGVLAAGAFEAIPAAVNEDVVRTNLLGYIHGAQAVLPIFKKQGYGMLINNISVGAWFPTPYMAAYSASKFGLRGFFESLRGELLQFPNIHICDLYPAFLDTPGMQHAANYTGKVLRPSPPLLDPRTVGRAVIALLNRPVHKSALGVFPHLLHLAYGLFPDLSRNLTAFAIRTYLHGAAASEVTSGNVLAPVGYGTSIDGGWRNTSLKPATQKGLLLFGLVAVLALLRRK